MEHINKEEECCGYENYETFSVIVMMDNDAGVLDQWRRTAREIQADAPNMSQVRDGIWTAEQATLYTLETAIKDYHKEECPIVNNSLWSMLLNTALTRVNWREVAEKVLSE